MTEAIDANDANHEYGSEHGSSPYGDARGDGAPSLRYGLDANADGAHRGCADGYVMSQCDDAHAHGTAA